MKFTVVVSPTSIHTQCFAEMATSLTWALTQLGHDAFRDTTVRPGTRGIILGARAGDSFTPDTILYNGEQVNKDGMWPGLVELYSKHTIWDYSAANAARYAEWSLKTPPVVRPGYCPVLVNRIPKRTRIYDVVFFGSVNDRRRKILDGLREKSLSVLEVPFGVYGKERDEFIAQANLCINIHYYESAIFESVRCSYLAMNGVHVLSERSVDDEGAEWGMPGAAYEDLVQTAHNYLMADAREEMARTQRSLAEGVSLLDDVRAAVASLDATPGVVEQVMRDVESTRVVERGLAVPVTLCMIVKNEAHIIERCLASVKPYITRWCIVDTGSTDGTQDVIRKYLADIPGNLHGLPWREFDGSRTDSLDLARDQCEGKGWLLLIDADETLNIDNGVLEIPNDGHDAYCAWISYGEGQRWARHALLRANKPWYFKMPRHEGLYCKTYTPSRLEPIDNFKIWSGTDSGRRKEDAHEKFMRDAKVLEGYLLKNPDDTRCCYYIAQSYRDAADSVTPSDRAAMQKALLAYLKRADMPGGFDQETFSAMFQAARCMTSLGYPPDRVVGQLFRAFNFRPSRVEPLHTLAVHFMANDQWALAELVASKAATTPPPNDSFTDFDLGVYNWKAKDAWARSLTWLNRCADAKPIYEELLLRPDIPPHERERLIGNLNHCLGRI